jgi:hypothetical protein
VWKFEREIDTLQKEVNNSFQNYDTPPVAFVKSLLHVDPPRMAGTYGNENLELFYQEDDE